MALPDAAQRLVERIEALLDEAGRLGVDAGGGEDAYALRATRDRYLRETLDAYARVPLAMRGVPDDAGKTADELLVEQLTILERATAQRLERASQGSRAELAANGRFLAERLGAAETLPAAPETIEATPSVTSRRFVDVLGSGSKRSRDLVNAVATRLHDAFPLLCEVDRGIFGAGAARRLTVTVPSGNDRLRYVLALAPNGEIETSCAKLVRGIAIRTERVAFDDWARALYDDLRAFAQTSAQAQASLEQLLQ